MVETEEDLTVEAERLLTAKRLSLVRAMRDRRLRNPIDWYVPGHPGNLSVDGRVLGENAGQLRFHQSDHKMRLMFPGNGFGKSTAMGAEAHWWATHTHPWLVTPNRPVLMVWFVKLKAQFEFMRVQLRDTVLGTVPEWKGGAFHWPDGSKLELASADRESDWLKWQGIPCDLVFFDEAPPRRLWREMVMRSRATRKTKYVVGATATTGDSWMEKGLFRPWLEFHQERGLDEIRAHEAQLHPKLWVWARGGIEDNPACDQADIEHYLEETAKMHPNERHVRMRGGFRSWTGNAVFEADICEFLLAELERLEAKAGPGDLGMFTAA